MFYSQLHGVTVSFHKAVLKQVSVLVLEPSAIYLSFVHVTVTLVPTATLLVLKLYQAFDWFRELQFFTVIKKPHRPYCSHCSRSEIILK